jgi:hypothetical protein
MYRMLQTFRDRQSVSIKLARGDGHGEVEHLSPAVDHLGSGLAHPLSVGYLTGAAADSPQDGLVRLAWAIKVTDEHAAWFTNLIKEDLATATQVAQAVPALREEGPALGRPLVDRLKGSTIHHLKELRPGSRGRS